MKLLKDIPKEEMLIVDQAPQSKQPMCKLYRRAPVEVSEVQYDREAKMWTTHNGLRFRHSRDMIRYYDEIMATQGRVLEPGTYSVAVKQVQSSQDRIVLQTKEGSEIIIKLS